MAENKIKNTVLRNEKTSYTFEGKNNTKIEVFKNGAFWCLHINQSILPDNYYFKTKADIMDFLCECNFI